VNVDDTIQVAFVTTALDAEAERAIALSGYTTGAATSIARKPEVGMESRFVDPVTLTISASLSLIAVRMVNAWLRSKERGVQIDLRKVPVEISRLESVPAGVIVVIDKSGKAKIHRQKYDKPEDLLPTLKDFLSP
jgi:hypothetical protein